jgi:adenosine deaminase
MRGIRQAQQAAGRELGLRTQLIMCFLRDLPADSALDTLQQSLAYRDWIAGVGLDSDEKGNPPVKFTEVFGRARSEGYHLTMHCDVDQQDSVTHLWQCMTACPISNSYVSDGLKAPEIKTMLERSLLVTINSDDPAYFPGYINENLAAVADAAQLGEQQIVQAVRNAFTIAWLPEDDRARYLRDLAAYATAQA